MGGRLRSLLRYAGTAGLAILLLPSLALAQAPWERAANNLATTFTGPLARSLALVSIVIGGLMKSNRQDSNAGIPLLKDIPILGYLFGAGSKKSEKTELIILITPNVVKSRAEADRITREFSGKIEHLTKELQ